MPLLNCYVDFETIAIFEDYARRHGTRPIEVAESALRAAAAALLPPDGRIQSTPKRVKETL